MTKDEAIKAMKEGRKVTHSYFSPGEFIEMRGTSIFDENGYNMRGINFDFWTDRKGSGWEQDWEIFIEPKK